ncbi:MAG: DUF58 domain-containing protein [Sandaracinaceae bacterium]|nr:DUF58 domain-containing protein [Sandaracinaceae bacterium]
MNDSRFVPGRRLAWTAAAGAPFALAGELGLAGVAAWDAAVVLGAWAESRALGRRVPTAERAVEARLVVGLPNRVTVRLHNPTKSLLRVVVRDDVPEGWIAEPDELSVELPPHGRREVTYTVTPPKRGAHAFGDLHLRLEGSLGLGARIVDIAAGASARVYPNVLGPRRYEMAAKLGDLRTIGFRNVRKSGGGGEFDQLREYVSGDPFRDLDWKSSAKRLRPVTRVLREERSQNVLLAIDAGRLMKIRAGSAHTGAAGSPGEIPVTKLDHAINAALLLAWVALRHGDRVGLVIFAEDVATFVPANRGPAQYRALLEALYDVEATTAYVDFRRFVEFIKLRVPRRSLIVMFSDLLDDTHGLPLAEHLSMLRGKHLPVCVTMEDAVAESLAARPAQSDDDAYQRAAAADLLADRAAVKARLRKGGVSLVEAPAGELAVGAVNRYLEIKARNLL